MKWTKEHLENHRAAFAKRKGSAHWNWKGDNVGYASLHEWMRTNYGAPTSCENCGSKMNLEWASKIRGVYTRNRQDWLWLCCSCHKTHDGIVLNIKKMRV